MQTIHYHQAYSSYSDSNFAIQAIGIRDIGVPGIIHRPKGSGDYVLIHFIDSAYVETDGKLKETGRGAFLVWEKGCEQKYGDAEKAWEHSWIHCDGARVRDLLKLYKIPLNKVVKFKDSALFDHYLLALHHELSAHARYNSTILQNCFQNLLIELSRLTDNQEQKTVIPEYVFRVKLFLESHFAEIVNIAVLAKQTGCSQSLLRREFKRYTGFSPLAYLMHLRMTHACSLLRDKNLRISEVSLRCGYEDIYHFSKLFKKSFGASPIIYRKQL
ncbi:MAG: helix-turn-helix transcriptional regulator [Fibrobacteres bacterium]|nr:helix-turn-helix transcriptional regulator [Fibrobacterota bacterium]